MKALCLLFGHAVTPQPQWKNDSQFRKCRCNSPFLKKDSLTRIRHHVGCFFKGHEYRKLGDREGREEYGCTHCGHPLLRRAESENGPTSFKKRVRYACNLFGHKRVAKIVERQGLIEYACECGHSFLKREDGLQEIKHPARCLFLGHSVRFVGGTTSAEYACVHCGHSFYL